MGQPAAIISSSLGNISDFGANHHWRQSLVCLDMPTFQQLEAYLAQVDKLLSASQKVGTSFRKKMCVKTK
ncbi:flavo domain protein [Brucella rhizosphaerae]|uniref:Flavo domain protein n=1 Tax=Brucella rhizosphaerae TaxID=571254 RepID=A0A256FPN1_9HYPH|nr:flavo domain protein [Brucella rhizosphaerae]